tara:strand:+ start:2288 stop:3223 length:936 start_codon:yes stop_codon:yes gene_type:complete
MSNDFNFFEDDVFSDIVGATSEAEAAQYSGVGGNSEWKDLDKGKYVIEYISADFRIGAESQFPVINLEFKPVAKFNEAGMLIRPNNFGKVKKSLMLFSYPTRRTYHDNGRWTLNSDESKRFDAEAIRGQGFIINKWDCQAYTSLLLRLTKNTTLNEYFAKKKFQVQATRNQEEHVVYKSFFGDEVGTVNGITNAPAIVEEWCDRLEGYNVDISANGNMPFIKRHIMVSMIDIIPQKNKDGSPAINPNNGEQYKNQEPITEKGWYTMFTALNDLELTLLDNYEQDVKSNSTSSVGEIVEPDAPGTLDDSIPF